jgi:hypothetical protein
MTENDFLMENTDLTGPMDLWSERSVKRRAVSLSQNLKKIWKANRPKGSRNGRLKSPNLFSFHYCQAVTTALNSHDAGFLKSFLRDVSIPEMRVVRKVYSLHNCDAAEQGIQDKEFTVDEFCQFFQFCCDLIPDGVMEPLSFRTCISSLPIYTFICSFQYTGNILYSGIKPISDQLDYLFQNKWCLSDKDQDENNSMELFEAVGSMVIYVNRTGSIEHLEFYVEQ